MPINNPFNLKATNNNVDINYLKNDNGIYYYELKPIKSDKTFDVVFYIKMLDAYSFYSPIVGRFRSLMQWSANKNNSSFYFSAPIISILNNDGNNKLTVSLLDTTAPSFIKHGIDDFPQNDEEIITITLLYNSDFIENYKTVLRIDTRNIAMVDSINDVAIWWKNELNLKNNIPQLAYEPLYSSWYNFHQNPTQDKLYEELVAASKLGFKNCILDDGWQFDGNGVGDYSSCGDWHVAQSKFYDFKGFIDKVHALNMKMMVWFPVPFVGPKTKDYQTFKDKLLYFDKASNAGVLDIRYKEVRKYIINIYLSFIEKYSIDGLKLDFIDTFKKTDETPAYNDKMDIKSVDEACKKLLDEINEKLIKVKKDFLIEFRQYYVGAEIVSHCNMLRVMDCAYDTISNRLGIMDIRLVDPFIAPHSDMLLWNKNEDPVHVGKQLINILFSVPQISVLLNEVDKRHLKIIKNYLAYYQEHRDIIFKGKLSFSHPEANYSLISSTYNNYKITALYATNSHLFMEAQEDIFNGTDSDVIYLENVNKLKVKIAIYDVYNEQISSLETDETLLKINVPLAGHMHIEKSK